MFIYNLKIDGNKLGKIFLGILLGIIIIITAIVVYRILGNNFFKTNDDTNSVKVQELTVSNYTNVLKTVHDNIDDYVGMRVSFSGYIHRMVDFKENQFVLARDMVISSDLQTVIVGFLCECDDIKQYADKTWIQIEGTPIIIMDSEGMWTKPIKWDNSYFTKLHQKLNPYVNILDEITDEEYKSWIDKIKKFN